MAKKSYIHLNKETMQVQEPTVAYQRMNAVSATFPCSMTIDELKAEVMQSVEDAQNGLGITIEQARNRHPRI